MTCFKNIDLNLFFILIPFIYGFQVVFGNNFIGLIPYLFLFVFLIRTIVFNSLLQNSYKKPSVLTFFVLLYTCLILGSCAKEFITEGFISAIRLGVLYFLPISLYFIVKNIEKDNDVKIILNIIIITTCLVSIEVLYEFTVHSLKVMPTWFEIKNYNYVKTISVDDPLQLLGWYRPTGLLEHVHVTGSVLSIGFIGSYLFYLLKGKIFYLLGTLLCFVGMIACAARLALASGALAFVLISCLYYKKAFFITKSTRKIFTVGLGVVLITGALYFAFHSHVYFWSNAYTKVIKTGQFMPSASTTSATGAISAVSERALVMTTETKHIVSSLKNEFIYLLFGHGWQTSASLEKRIMNDDFFVLQILGQIGIVGLIVFYGMFFCGLIFLVHNLKNLSAEKQLLLVSAGVILFLLGISTLHSGVVLRKSVYYLLFLALGIVHRFTRVKGISGTVNK